MNQSPDSTFNLIIQDSPFPIQTEFLIASNISHPNLVRNSSSFHPSVDKELRINNFISKPKTRKVLDLKNKRIVIELSTLGLSHQAIADKFAVGRSTVTKILLNKKQILDESLELYDDSRKRIRKGQFNRIEIELARFCLSTNSDPILIVEKEELPSFDTEDENEENENIATEDSNINDITKFKVRSNLTRQMILDKAKNLAKQMGMTKFQPNKSWFFRFKRKFRLKFPANGYSKTQGSLSDLSSSVSSLAKNFIDKDFDLDQILCSNFPTQTNFGRNEYQSVTNIPPSSQNEVLSFPDIRNNSLCHSTEGSLYLLNQPAFELNIIDIPNQLNSAHLSSFSSGRDCFDSNHNNDRGSFDATSSFSSHYLNHRLHLDQQHQQKYQLTKPSISTTNYFHPLQTYFPQHYNNSTAIKFNTSLILGQNSCFTHPILEMTDNTIDHQVAQNNNANNLNQIKPHYQQYFRDTSASINNDFFIGYP